MVFLQDNSVEWLASSLLKCSLWLKKCQKTELENFLSQFPSESAVQAAATESQVVLDSDEGNSDCDELDEVSDQQIKKQSRRCMQADEDGWTTVIRR